MTIKTEKSVAADVKEFLLKREHKKTDVLETLTKPEFLDVALLAGEETKDRLELIADAVDGMLEPINRQVRKITDEQNYIESKKTLLKQIVKQLKAQLTQIVKIKEALVDKDIEKIREGLEELQIIVKNCKEKTEKI